jgi:hypothetical protein
MVAVELLNRVEVEERRYSTGSGQRHKAQREIAKP